MEFLIGYVIGYLVGRALTIWAFRKGLTRLAEQAAEEERQRKLDALTGRNRVTKNREIS